MTRQRKNKLKYKIQNSRSRLLLSHPFFALLLMHIDFYSDTSIEKISTNGISIFFSPNYLEKLTERELDYILCHQIMHIAYGNIFRHEKFKGAEYHFACDIYINSLLYQIGFKDEKYSHLGYVYRQIPGTEEAPSKLTIEEIYNLYPYNLVFLSEEQRNTYLPDNDYCWGKSSKEYFSSELIVERAEGFTSLFLETNSQQEMESKISSLIKTMDGTKSKYGDIPNFIKRKFGKIKKPVLDWKTILNNFIQTEICDYSFSPPDRRFDHTGFFLPDYNEKDYIPKDILFMVDTSGSVNEKELTSVYSEILGSLEQFNNKLVAKIGFFDCDITEPVAFSNVDELLSIVPYGGGGTDFTSVFNFINGLDDNNLPACVVIFTDGDGRYPLNGDDIEIPILWIINNNECTPPFGKIIRINDTNQ